MVEMLLDMNADVFGRAQVRIPCSSSSFVLNSVTTALLVVELCNNIFFRNNHYFCSALASAGVHA